MDVAQARDLHMEETMIISTKKLFTAVALTLTIIAGTTAAAQAGGGRANGARASGVALASSQSGPVVRDHRGQTPSGSQTSSSGWNGQVRDHRTGHQFCFGGLFGGTQCTQL
jgi:hypothetical protein